ncbi:hypothetical protein A3862_16190 [Methylobacterium sp. XJLW]|nr:hypothetical protein A3862_16190 [Methylobacterium sp. XJLW]
MHQDTAAGLIRSAAQQGGFTLTPEAEATAAAKLAPMLQYDQEAGTYVYAHHSPDTCTIVDGQLVDVPVGTFVLNVAQRHGTRSQPAGSPETKLAPAYVRTDTMGQLARAFDAGQAAAAKSATDKLVADILASGRNPWLTGNRTHQAAIQSRMPAVADKMKIEADPLRTQVK